MNRPRRNAAGGRALAGILAAWLAVSAFPGCGAKRLSVGSAPFPADRPVLRDVAGVATADLPAGPEPFRLVFLDFPWCPPCEGMWEGIRSAVKEFPPGTLRIHRVLFDRERLFPGREPIEVPPWIPSPARTPAPVDSGGGEVPVATWTAIPDSFREQYSLVRAPILLLLDRQGVTAARWIGASPSLSASLAGEIRKRTVAPPSSER